MFPESHFDSVETVERGYTFWETIRDISYTSKRKTN